MISDTGEVRLIDWDRATSADPLEDIGSFLVEAFEQETRGARCLRPATFPASAKRLSIVPVSMASPTIFAGGLIGAVVAAKSPRNTHEFLQVLRAGDSCAAGWRSARRAFGEQLQENGMSIKRRVGDGRHRA